MATVFVQVDQTDLYDLRRNGRVLEYDVEPDDFAASLRRRRIPADEVVYVEDSTGHRTRIMRRR